MRRQRRVSEKRGKRGCVESVRDTSPPSVGGMMTMEETAWGCLVG